MRKFETPTPPEGMDFYSIETSPEGKKQIHISGYIYLCDDGWRSAEVCWFIEPLDEFIKHIAENEGYVDETMGEYKQYIGDCSEEEIVETINHYFDGNPPQYYLDYRDITTDTPCGDYAH